MLEYLEIKADRCMCFNLSEKGSRFFLIKDNVKNKRNLSTIKVLNLNRSIVYLLLQSDLLDFQATGRFKILFMMVKSTVSVLLPVGTCAVAECGTIAASCGMEPISGSGVLLGAEGASGDLTILGFSCTKNTHS